MPKIKNFGWLLLVDRLNTRDMLRRRHMHLEEGYLCVLCPGHYDETAMHLFFDCKSSISRWTAIGIHWQQQDNIFERLQHQRNSFEGPYFMDIFMIAA